MLTHDTAWDVYPGSPVIAPRVRVTAYMGSNTVDVPVTDGEVVINSRQYPRTMVRVVTADTSLVPHALSDLLQPFGARIRVEYGYADTSGAVAYLTVADGPLVKTTATRPGGTITLESWDDAYLVASYVMDPPQENWGGSGSVKTIDGLIAIAQSIPGAGIAATVVNTCPAARNVPIPDGWTWAGDSWAAVLELASLSGADVYFDAARRLIVRPQPTVGASVFTFRTGPTGTVTMYESTQARPYNWIFAPFVDGSGARNITGMWEDTSPTTGTTSPVGYSIYLAPDQTGNPTPENADRSAATIAARVRRARTVRLETVPVPWIEPGDTVSVQTVGGPLETHLVSGITLPLGPRAMSITTQDPTYTGPM